MGALSAIRAIGRLYGILTGIPPSDSILHLFQYFSIQLWHRNADLTSKDWPHNFQQWTGVLDFFTFNLPIMCMDFCFFWLLKKPHKKQVCIDML